jgi:release factor glutamine methyltransferase
VTTTREALRRTADRLAEAGVESPRVDAEILLAHVLQVKRSDLHADSRRDLSDDELAELDGLAGRREAREPLAYVLGEWGFRRLVLSVDERVLVPRPETEVVVERCLARIAAIPEPRVLDVGTGSGAIALAIADEHAGARVTAVDASHDALVVARENVARTGVDVEVVQRDLFDGLPEGPWDLVVSNPPYVQEEELGALEPEIRDWEPRAAVVGEGATEAVAKAALDVLEPGGALVLETAGGDAERVAELLGGLGYTDVLVTKDLAGRSRVAEGTAPAKSSKR